MRIRTLFLVCILSVLLFLPFGVLGKVVISEVMWMGTDLSAFDEWVEVAATGSGELLEGWTLTSINSSGNEAVIGRFGTGTVIGSGEHLVLSRFSATGSRLLDDPFVLSPTMSLPNTKLLLRLRNALGVIMDQIDDGIGSPFAGINAALPVWKASMERLVLNGSGSQASNWRAATTFLGFDDGASLFGTPGFLNGSGPSTDTFAPLDAENVLAEVIDTEFGRSLRLLWEKSISLDVAAQRLTFSPLLLSGSGSFHFSPSATGAFLGGFDPAIAYNGTLVSIDHNGNISTGVSISIEPYIEPQSSSISSEAFSSDSSESSASSASSVASNSSASSQHQSLLPTVLISEIITDPEGDDSGQWVEVWNKGPEAIDITGWRLINAVSGRTFTLGAGSGGTVIPGSGVLLFPRLETGLSFTHASGSVVLVNTSGDALSSLSFPALPAGVSLGLQQGSTNTTQLFCAPTPGRVNGPDLWDAAISIQSGTPVAVGKVTLNLEAVPLAPFSSIESCHFDYGDGHVVESCNPASHTFSSVGRYTVTARMQNHCSTTVEHILLVEVLPSQSSSSVSVNTQGTPLHSSEEEKNQTSSLTDGQLVIFGVLPNPEGTDTGKEWIEFRNTGNAAVHLQGWGLQTTTRTYSLPNVSISPLHTYRLTQKDVNFSLTNTTGSASLIGPDGTLRSVVVWKNAAVGKVYRAAPPRGRFTVQIREVIDGDTVDVLFEAPPANILEPKARVRLIGIDAPEIHDANTAIAAYGIETKIYLEALIKGKKPELEFDTELEDTYGRLLGYLYIDGALIQAEILKEGLATAPREYPHSKMDVFIQLEEQAKALGKGHWKSESAPSIEQKSSSASLVVSVVPAGALLISEIYPSPLADEEEWIEIQNLSDSEVSLTGLLLDDAKEEGSKVQKIPDDSRISPQSFLVIESGRMSIALNNGGDSVRLLTASGTEIASVTYPAIKAGMAYARANDGTWCQTTTSTKGSANTCVLAAAKLTKAGSKSGSSKAVKAKSSSSKKATVTYRSVTQGSSSEKPRSAFQLAGALISGSGNGGGSGMQGLEMVFLASAGSGFAAYVGAGLAVRKGKKELKTG